MENIKVEKNEDEDISAKEREAHRLVDEMSQFMKDIKDSYAAYNILSELIKEYLFEYFSNDNVTLIATVTPKDCNVNLNRLIKQ